MEDGGWSAHARAAAAAAKKKAAKTAAPKKKNKAKNKKKKDKNDTTLREQPRHAVPFAHLPGITDALRARLAAIGATEPAFVIGKSLATSDVNRDQARLLFSCKKREEAASRVIAGAFTGTEMRLVKDKALVTGGLLVTAFDRDGRSYDLVCKYLYSNDGYRFITGWKGYVVGNGLGKDMCVELWRFRSRRLHNRYEADGKGKRVPVMVESGDPDGSLGLVLLHYEKELLGPQQQQAAADDQPDEAQPVQETENGHMESKATTATEGKKRKLLADDGVTCARPIKSKMTTIAEDKLADDGGECAEEVLKAARGLLQLRRRYSRGGGGRGPAQPES